MALSASLGWARRLPWWGWLVAAACLLLVALVIVVGSPLQQTQASLSAGAARWAGSADSIRGVQALCTDLGLEELAFPLRQHSFGTIAAIAAAERPPGSWVKPFHWQRLHRAARAQTVPPPAQSPPKLAAPPAASGAAVPGDESPAARVAVCSSWANSAALRSAVQKAPAAGGAASSPPVCSAGEGLAAFQPRQLLPDVAAAAAASGGQLAGGVADTISKRHGWWRNQVTAEQVAALRTKGSLDLFVMDVQSKLLYCGAPGTGDTYLRAWMLRRHGLWRKGAPAEAQFAGPHLKSGAHFTDQELMSALNGGEYFKFTFAGDPALRTLSTFSQRFEGCLRRSPAAECAQWVKALLGPGRQAPRDFGYADFLAAAQQQQRNRVTYLSAHWLPAVGVCGLGDFTYDFIGRLDGTDADLQLLYDATGLQGLSQGQWEALMGAAPSALPLAQLGATEEIAAATLQQVSDVFRDDARLLGFTSEAALKLHRAYLQQLQKEQDAASGGAAAVLPGR
eukprot:TRINITY_DN5747_c0_g1_i5.p1 TRINITY_DN5747_c0_g1~~TRINITY_DN5747_c0_g1_i5.p1  ORF type:complete len:524 (+),score=164.12 TRINITY_DN5747_c0_g1_i5:47-1573(+)